jgi:probable F420-dependent oxidoreductase
VSLREGGAGNVVAVKIRIGYGLGTRTLTNEPASFGGFVDLLEELGFDSLWLSERITGEAPDPLIALAFAAARTTRMKFGTSVLVVPGRNPVVLAKELATLDRLSRGRLLPAVGLGVADPLEQQAFGVQRGERARIFDEVVPLLRRLWTEDVVDHDGDHFHLEGMRVLPKPVQRPIDVWLGGIAPSELKRVGRLGDGWLPSFCTPDEVAEGIGVIQGVAADHDRMIDPEHFGALIAYRDGPVPDVLTAFIQRRRPDVDPDDVVPERSAIVDVMKRMIDVGASKFVLIPLNEPTDWRRELEEIAELALPLEN